ncbi:hypothetical protein ACFYUL_23945 [Streptomyces sp. NPDC004311]|uniref:hypothetical protein n=1 Tax=Streptomyces sp. NPDC004311 TaxID=3364698 RepID=UPI003675FFE6
MSDNYTAALLMAQMRGLPQPVREQQTEMDPTTRALLRQARGDTDYSHVHESNAKGQREHERAVRQRTAQLQGQGMTSHYAEAKARRQLAAEATQKHDQDNRRRVYDQMVASNRAEMEANSTAGLRGRIKQATEDRRKRADEGFQRLVDAVMAELKADKS